MKTIKALVVGLTILVAIPCASLAQWKGDGTQRLEAGVPLLELSTLPEYRSDMSLDCFVAYLAMDSAARVTPNTAPDPQQAMSISLDSLRVLARFHFAAYDYNPLLMKSYIRQSNQLHLGNIPGAIDPYQSFPVERKRAVEKAIRNRRNELGLDYTMLLLAEYIYKVRVVDVRSGIDSTFAPKPWTNVACEVVTVFKGLYVPENCWPDISENSGNPGTDQVNPGPSPCFIYGHVTGKSAGSYSAEQERRSPGKSPEDRTRQSQLGTIVVPEVGEEAYVFLTTSYHEGTVILWPHDAFEKTGGVFRIVDGKVQDIGNFWGLGAEVDEVEFDQMLTDKIETIKHWWVQ